MAKLTLEEALAKTQEEFQVFMDTPEGLVELIHLGVDSKELTARMNEVLDREFEAMSPAEQERIMLIARRLKTR